MGFGFGCDEAGCWSGLIWAWIGDFGFGISRDRRLWWQCGYRSVIGSWKRKISVVMGKAYSCSWGFGLKWLISVKTMTHPEDEEEEGFCWLTGFGVMVVAMWRWCGWKGGCCVDGCIEFSLWYLTTGWERDRGRETEMRERMEYILLYNLYYFNVLYCKIKVGILRLL